MILRRHDRMTGGRPALAAVEFAVILLVVGLIVVGMMEMGRALMVKETLSDAARRGCRAGIQPLASTASITTEVNKVLQDHNIAPADATITVKLNDVAADAGAAKQNDKVSVSVSVPVSKVSWITPYFLPSNSIESETTVMLRQR